MARRLYFRHAHADIASAARSSFLCVILKGILTKSVTRNHTTDALIWNPKPARVVEELAEEPVDQTVEGVRHTLVQRAA